MYKCFKKVNNEWQVFKDFTSEFDELQNSEGYYRASNTITERANALECVSVFRNSNGDFYLKSDCAKFTLQNNTYYIKEYTQTEFDALNNQTLNEKYGIIKCEECGTYEQTYRAIKVGRSHYYCKRECASRHATQCNNCGNWYMKNSSFTTEHLNERQFSSDYKMCNTCFSKLTRSGRLRKCEDCNTYSLRCEYIRVDGSYHYYCSNCANSHRPPRIIRGYHEQHNEGWQPQYATYEDVTPNTFKCGVELECELKDSDKSTNEVAYEIHKLVNANKKLFEFETDGSLRNGYETISQPCSMAWWQQNADLIQKMLAKMSELGCVSHNSPRCGLHVHIGRNFFTDYEYETRFVRLFYHLKTDLHKFSRRKDGETYYCAFSGGVTPSNVFTAKEHLKGHNTALNLANEHTIEVRIFKGTLDFVSYMSCIELCYNLACYVKDNKENNYSNVTFREVVDYKPTRFLKAYLEERKFFEVKGA